MKKKYYQKEELDVVTGTYNSSFSTNGIQIIQQGQQMTIFVDEIVYICVVKEMTIKVFVQRNTENSKKGEDQRVGEIYGTKQKIREIWISKS